MDGIWDFVQIVLVLLLARVSRFPSATSSLEYFSTIL